MPFKTEVSAAADETGVPKSLIWAIMREESHFRPRAISFVGAQGLMQLMPATAAEMAQIPESTFDVYAPRTNIRLGSRYLNRVQRYTRSSWPVVAPGYNAGQGALKRWLRKNGHLDFDLFVEMIPYDEARAYTKKVNRSLAVYRRRLKVPMFRLLGKTNRLKAEY